MFTKITYVNTREKLIIVIIVEGHFQVQKALKDTCPSTQESTHITALSVIKDIMKKDSLMIALEDVKVDLMHVNTVQNNIQLKSPLTITFISILEITHIAVKHVTRGLIVNGILQIT